MRAGELMTASQLALCAQEAIGVGARLLHDFGLVLGPRMRPRARAAWSAASVAFDGADMLRQRLLELERRARSAKVATRASKNRLEPRARLRRERGAAPRAPWPEMTKSGNRPQNPEENEGPKYPAATRERAVYLAAEGLVRDVGAMCAVTVMFCDDGGPPLFVGAWLPLPDRALAEALLLKALESVRSSEFKISKEPS